MKQDILTKLSSVIFIIALITLIIVGKILYIQIIQKEKWISKEKITDYKELPANRGNIYSEQGKILAISVPYHRVLVDFRSSAFDRNNFYLKADSLAIALANLFKDKDASAYLQELKIAEVNKEGYHLLHSKVSHQQLKKLKTFPVFRKGKFKGGLIVEDYSKRLKPHGKFSARTIGYLTKNNNAVGIELAYDNYLKGVKGLQLMQKIAGGNVWMPINNKGTKIEPKEGKDIVTTFDLNMMEITENALLRQLKKLEAKHGTAILMEVKTGDIKAMANLSRTEEGEYQENYNLALAESSEPGSTFKLMSLIALLEDGYATLDDKISTQGGVIKYKNFTIRDSQKGGYGTITLKQAFEHSSNVAISKFVWNNYIKNPEKFVDRIYNMNLNEKLGVEIEGEGSPLIKYPGDKHWYTVSLPQMSIGYEVKLTPLQIITFYNAVANNGKMMKPRFVKEIKESSHVVKKIPTEVLNYSICSKKTIEDVKKCLVGVVENGTAKNIQSRKYKIAGKTGTAQIANDSEGYESEKGKRYQASFAGYFPADNPKYSCIVVIYSPKKVSYYGSGAAAPVFKEISDNIYATALDIHPAINKNKIANSVTIPYSKSGYKKDLDYIFKVTNIPVQYDNTRSNNWVTTIRQENYVKLEKKQISKYTVPHVKGMGAKDALFILENMGLNVQIKGRGRVIKQSIEPGKKFRKGDKITIELA